MTYQTPGDKDPQLWDIAKRRASFKSHFATYILVNLFLWGLWFFSGREDSGDKFPWPVWPTFGWGIGLFFHYLGAYGSHRNNSVDREYEKLMKERERS